jgi:Uma2 family endonuclease
MQVTTFPQPPRTLLEVFKMLPEGTCAELIDNSLYMSPARTTSHQGIVGAILSSIHGYASETKIGKVLVSPIDVYLNSKNAFQPDIVFIANENLSIIKESGIYGVPDLVIEILSPGTEKLDRNKKKLAYEQAGVKEYWIVAPLTKECSGYQLTKGKYTEFKKEKGKLSSALLKHVFKF